MIKETSSPLNAAIDQLKRDWDQLNDRDRARAVAKFRQSGMSIRQIAKQLNRGESGLRRLLLALQAPAADLIAARQGQLSTNELVRRSKAASVRRANRKREDEEHDREVKAVEGSKLICDWLRDEGVYGPDGEQILGDVLRELVAREMDGSLPTPPKNTGIRLTELIKRCRPNRPRDENAASNHWFAEWLFRWAFFALPDQVVLEDALSKAKEIQEHR
jgi:transposase